MEEHVQRRTKERLPVEATVNCRIPATPIASRINNISSDGCMAEITGASLQMGGTVLLELLEGWHVLGHVLWCEPTSYGIKFEQPRDRLVIAPMAADPAAPVDSTISASPRAPSLASVSAAAVLAGF
jgi:hypothetical protein